MAETVIVGCVTFMKIDRRSMLAGIGALSLGVFSGSLRAAAQVNLSSETFDLGDQGALYRVPIDVGGGRQVLCTAAVLPRRSFAAKIVQQQTRDGALTAVRDIALSQNAAVAINGGRFNGAFAPDGLLIVDGKTVGRKRADLMGYLVIDDAGNASVTDRPNLLAARYAVQGDPLLIEPGGKMGMIREDNRIFRRTIIAQSGDLIVAMVTSPVSLFSLAYALMERPDAFYLNHFDAALNMSGAATTSFYAKLPNGGHFDVPAFWPNRDVITFLKRSVA